ncbi:hypothetical protein FC56_GL000241 [Lentilactobacillus senioris DSM 24302 = JCM 17472]|uniref:IrrE N-terminal-like domain-containing protein n=1 Tax=Lentilactobacillus senioris DSM 24302 = JCM 17472 TaxID=1423802 RepID=A0A0R2CZJ6_9LACO|nr:ImmA/IrrE family metallo-endopeptidase [Lentilactobacillus senioris]KRM93529.1 hypothetical protein FC56_GL000241 [Lentilactobacillus senioris DSM 24302 = JCM 17472]
MHDLIKNTIKTMIRRYGTADPFVIAEKLNIDVRWVNFGERPFGKTFYDEHAPVVMLNKSLKYKPQRYFTLAHEIGHVVMHADLNGYYTGRLSYGPLELQASEFASGLLALLYVEENGVGPEYRSDLVHAYGYPEE